MASNTSRSRAATPACSFPLLPAPRRFDCDQHAPGAAVGTPVTTRLGPSSLPAQGYRIEIAPTQVRIEAGDEAGAFYGRSTLDQLRRLAGKEGRLPAGTIVDWPEIARRGVMLDVSRDKVPSLDTLFALVDRLASWKINHLELYMEHTFAYRKHEEVWAQADPYTATDIKRLEAHCAAHHIELSANQNTLGHMERWLIHPRYRGLGIRRGMVRNPFGMLRPASTLDPSKVGSLRLVRELLAELLEVFSSRHVHVGLDEPWDLPPERYPEWGTWAGAIATSPEMVGRTMLVWGDMLCVHPDLVFELPPGSVVCEWGYEADHPFATRAAFLAEHGVETWLCPGTSSWLSIVGRVTNAVENTRAAAEAAADAGASGVMTTDWGDFGHLQYLPISEPGLAAAAAFSWCPESNRHLDAQAVAKLLSAHSFEDRTGNLGEALHALGDLHRVVPLQFPNLSTLVLHLYLPQLPVGAGLTEGLATAHLDAVTQAVATARAALHGARPQRVDGSLVIDEIEAATDMVLLLCDDARARLRGDGHLSSVPSAKRAQLAGHLDGIIDRHRALWSARNRAGGLADSLAWLEHLARCYRTGDTDPDWAGPLHCL